MRKKPFFMLLASLAYLCGVGVSVAAEQAFLADRHTARGVTCEACHGTSKTGGMRLDAEKREACVGCHGWYDQVAAKTVPANKEDMNPHNQHDGNLPCTECHKGHKQGVNYCAECHYYTFKVP